MGKDKDRPPTMEAVEPADSPTTSDEATAARHEASGAPRIQVPCPCHDKLWSMPPNLDELPIPAARAWARLSKAFREKEDIDIHLEANFAFLEGAMGPQQWRTFVREHPKTGQAMGMVGATIKAMSGASSGES